jgi:hypothetical protein
VEQIDAAVIGAGPAGSAAVAILASGGVATVMLTGSDATKPHWTCFRNLGCQLPPCMRSCALPIARWVTVELPCRPYCIRCSCVSARIHCLLACGLTGCQSHIPSTAIPLLDSEFGSRHPDCLETARAAGGTRGWDGEQGPSLEQVAARGGVCHIIALGLRQQCAFSGHIRDRRWPALTATS